MAGDRLHVEEVEVEGAVHDGAVQHGAEEEEVERDEVLQDHGKVLQNMTHQPHIPICRPHSKLQFARDHPEEAHDIHLWLHIHHGFHYDQNWCHICHHGLCNHIHSERARGVLDHILVLGESIGLKQRPGK